MEDTESSFSFAMLVICSLTNSLQSMQFWVSANGTNKQRHTQKDGPRGLGATLVKSRKTIINQGI